MSLKERLEAELKTAMKNRDRARLECLRMLKAKVQEKEVALRGSGDAERKLTDDDVTEVVTSYAKQRRDSIDSYRAAGREDLAGKEEAELAIVTEYLPQQLGEDEVRAIVAKAIAEAGASSPKDMGAVMKLVMPQVKGKADGKLVNGIVRELLAG
ncbi:MAG: GatB/YqeY domain-containing protein [bacterium]|nr:GatB/YqeY domain-containing protein [bacterium]